MVLDRYATIESEDHPPICPNDRISEWQISCAFPTTPSNPLKRERSMCPEDEPTSDSPCHGSPKRQRLHNSEDIQSSPQFANKLTLNAGNTFGPLSESSGFSSDPQRSPSPTRISRQDLKEARPPIIFHSICGLNEAPPQLVEELGDRLANGVNSGFIPHGLSVYCNPLCSCIMLT